MVRDVRAEALVEYRHVTCSYGGAPAIQDVSFGVGRGEFVGIVGPSGAGKTTVLRALLGLVNPTFGSVVRDPELSLGYVPQVDAVDWNFPVTVTEVLAMSIARPRWRRLSSNDRSRIEDVLEQLGLGGLANRPINALSGGQQQRVFVARALIHEPDVLVLDEPAGGVDVAARHELLHLLADLYHAGTTIVLTTHDINGLAAHLPRLLCFNRTVVADGPPGEVLHPYVLERTYGASMDVLQHGGMPVVLEARGHGMHTIIRKGRSA